MTDFPKPPLTKIMRAWRYISPGMRGEAQDSISRVQVAASTNDTAAWNSTAGNRKTADKQSAGTTQTVAEAQTILTAHSDTT